MTVRGTSALREPLPGPRRGSGRPRIGISACLLGREVRYDGGHRRDRFLTDVLGFHFEWVPVCPEVEIGLGTPRPPIRLERAAGTRTHLVMPSTGDDLTERMERWSEAKTAELAALELCGYVLKKDSPSCGMERVKVYGAAGAPRREGRGLFAAALLERLPLPVEEEGRLGEPSVRENFIVRVFALHRWRAAVASGVTRPGLHAFHRRYELHLVARGRAGARRLGRLLAEAPPRSDPARLASRYLEGFSAAMARPPGRVGHLEVLRDVAGGLSPRLGAGERAEVSRAIDAYRERHSPLSVPLGLLRRHVRRLDVRDLRAQAYLEPDPGELSLLEEA